MDDEIYHVALGITYGGKVMATADGMTEDVYDCLNKFEHTFTLRLGAGPNEVKPPWGKLATALGKLSATYKLALASPATVTGTGSSIQLSAGKSGSLAAALAAGGSLVVTLEKWRVEQSPSWEEVATVLATLDPVVYIAEMTCVGPRPPGP